MNIDPQEQRQEVLIKRVINSVDRLCTSLSDLTNQMEVNMLKRNFTIVHSAV